MTALSPPAVDRPLRLLLLYETLAPDYAGGIETRNAELAAALARRGVEVVLAGFGASDGPAPTGVTRLSLGEPRGLYNLGGRRSNRRALDYAWRAARLSVRDFDVVETANMPFAHLPGVSLRCRASGVPLLVVWYEVWGAYWRDYVGPLLAPLYRTFESAAARLGTRVAATSELGRGRLALLRRRGDVALTPCGLDLERFAVATADAPPGPPLVFAGRLLAHKRVDLLLAALRRLGSLASLVPHGPLLAIYGDGPERARLVALADELGVAPRVQFHGQVPHLEDVWRGLAGARLVVQPSLREGFGIVPLEAMAAGAPVVFARSTESAVGELVRDGIEGLACEPTAEAFATAIASLLTDEARRFALARAARQRARDFDWPALAAAYEQLLRQLATRRAAPRQAMGGRERPQ